MSCGSWSTIETLQKVPMRERERERERECVCVCERTVTSKTNNGPPGKYAANMIQRQLRNIFQTLVLLRPIGGILTRGSTALPY